MQGASLYPGSSILYPPPMTGWHKAKNRQGRAAPRRPAGEIRLRIFQGVVLLAMAAIVGRLFTLQVLSHKFYASLASNQHSILQDLFPERGAIYLRDPKSPDGRFPAAINKTLSTVFANCEE